MVKTCTIEYTAIDALDVGVNNLASAAEIRVQLEGHMLEADQAIQGSKYFDQDGDEECDEYHDASPEEKMKNKLAAWEVRKKKYKKYADEGKVEKLQKAIEGQSAKWQKAKEKSKDPEYVNYKHEKIVYTKCQLKVAMLVQNLKKAGLSK